MIKEVAEMKIANRNRQIDLPSSSSDEEFEVENEGEEEEKEHYKISYENRVQEEREMAEETERFYDNDEHGVIMASEQRDENRENEEE